MLDTRNSPFPAMFSKAFLFQVVKSRDCVVKGESPFFSAAFKCGNDPEEEFS